MKSAESDKKEPSGKSFAVVTTTINIPRMLEAYFSDAAESGSRLTHCFVVGDNKTPPQASAFCEDLEKSTGTPCRYLSVQDQLKYLSRWPEFSSFLPWNCIQRRNVGLLLAYESKADIIVTLDDDNLIHQPGYFRGHSHLGDRTEIQAVETKAGWWNVCEMLEEPGHVPFYHRGHPLSKRWLADELVRSEKSVKGRAVVNAGLWLGEPDVDGLARLYQPYKGVVASARFRPRIGCDIGTWAPFNSQNTALLREVIPAYFLFPFIGRYDDIWASYIVRHISDYLKDYVTYGDPLVRQDRNVHNYFKDFDAERFGLECNDVFLDALKSCALKADGYREAYRQISEQFPDRIKKYCSQGKIDPALFDAVVKGMRHWTEIFKTLN